MLHTTINIKNFITFYFHRKNLHVHNMFQLPASPNCLSAWSHGI